MKKKFSKIVSLLLVIAVVLSFTACKGDDTQGQTPQVTEKMFNVALTAPFTGFDPLRTNDATSTYVNAQIYETLYLITPSGDIQPLLAQDMPQFSEDGLSATITLKPNVTFHDGTAFNSEAVKYTFELIKNPDFGSARASIADSITSIECIDETTVKLNLAYEDGVLLAKLAHTNSAIVSPTAQAAQDLMINPCGTGPYKFVSSISGSNVVLTRNDAYWDGVPEIKDITMTIIAEEATAIARIQTGEADLMPTLSVEGIGRVQSIPNVTMGSSDSAQIYYLALRPNSYVNPLMENKDFRTAICKALDTQGFVEFILENHGTVAKSVIGPKVLGYDVKGEENCIGYDLEGAKKLVADNGWANEEIVFLCPSTPTYTPMGEYFQANLKAVGFNNVKLESIDWSAWLTESKAENRFDITLAAWSNVTRDGSELFEPNWHSKVSTRTRIDSSELDALIEESKTTSELEARTQALQKANKLLLENAYVAPVSNAESRFVYNSAVYENVELETSGVFYVKNITYKK